MRRPPSRPAEPASSPSPTTAATSAGWSRSTSRRGKRTVLTPELKWDVETYELSDDGRLLAYAVNEDGFSRLHIVDRSTGRELAKPDLPGGVLTNFKFSPDGQRLALSMSTATSAGDVWTWDVAGIEADPLDAFRARRARSEDPRRAAS